MEKRSRFEVYLTDRIESTLYAPGQQSMFFPCYMIIDEQIESLAKTLSRAKSDVHYYS